MANEYLLTEKSYYERAIINFHLGLCAGLSEQETYDRTPDGNIKNKMKILLPMSEKKRKEFLSKKRWNDE